jgi:hypothetical protein
MMQTYVTTLSASCFNMFYVTLFYSVLFAMWLPKRVRGMEIALCVFTCWSVNKNVLSFRGVNAKVTKPNYLNCRTFCRKGVVWGLIRGVSENCALPSCLYTFLLMKTNKSNFCFMNVILLYKWPQTRFGHSYDHLQSGKCENTNILTVCCVLGNIQVWWQKNETKLSEFKNGFL